jgi:hypothetical protein
MSDYSFIPPLIKSKYGYDSLALNESKIIDKNNRKNYRNLFTNIAYWNKKNQDKAFKMFIKDGYLVVNRIK